MTWKVEFELDAPDGTSAYEIQVTVNDAVQAMTEKEGPKWHAEKVQVYPA